MDAAGARPKALFVILTHEDSPRIRRLIARAREGLAGYADVLVAAYVEEDRPTPPILSGDWPARRFTRADFDALGYPGKMARTPWTLIPGNTDLMTLKLWRERPGLEHVWLMEGDVDYTGDLGALIAELGASPADLLATSIRPQPENWFHGFGLSLPEGWQEEGERLQAFLPFFRASAALLAALDAFYRAGGTGHNEITWPLVARARGLALEDIGGAGPFTPAARRGRLYSSDLGETILYPGTFRYRPLMRRPGRRPDTLWHPIKDDGHAAHDYWLRVAKPKAQRLARRTARRILALVAPRTAERLRAEARERWLESLRRR